MRKLKDTLVELTRENSTVLFISNRNLVVLLVATDSYCGQVTIVKKYFNQIISNGYVEGALTEMPGNLDGSMKLFMGFNFK